MGNEIEYDGANYDELNAHRTWDLPFYVAQALLSRGPVLEIGCGTGRITLPIAKAGVEIVGVDVSASMLGRATAKSISLARQPAWILADACTLELTQKFDLIILTGNTIRHFDSRLEKLLTVVRGHLAKNARFIFDFLSNYPSDRPNFNRILRRSEFTIKNHWGDFTGKPFAVGDGVQVLECSLLETRS